MLEETNRINCFIIQFKSSKRSFKIGIPVEDFTQTMIVYKRTKLGGKQTRDFFNELEDYGINYLYINDDTEVDIIFICKE